MPYCDISKLTVFPESTTRQVMDRINASALQIALVIDQARHLQGTVTDGDIRRAILAGMSLETTVATLLERKQTKAPISAPVGAHEHLLLNLMRSSSVQHLPLVNSEGMVEDLVRLEDLIPREFPQLRAVIMAGGLGNRLRPLTDQLPKPMLPVGGRPLLERTIERIRDAGIRHVNVTTHYKPEKIIDYFGDGKSFGVELVYVQEESPLGTAGSLAGIGEEGDTLLVINGDILTEVDFKAMLAFHSEHEASLTVAVRKYDLTVPYGVIESDGVRVHTLVEKPVVSLFVNAGIYLLAPCARKHIPQDGRRIDMTELITLLLNSEHRIISFPLHEYWLDIGQPGDYTRAQEDVKTLGPKVGVYS